LGQRLQHLQPAPAVGDPGLGQGQPYLSLITGALLLLHLPLQLPHLLAGLVQGLLPGGRNPLHLGCQGCPGLTQFGLSCTECGHTMAGCTRQRKAGRTRYYRDTAWRKGHECSQRMVRAVVVEEQVVEQLRRLRLPRAWVRRVAMLAQGGAEVERLERQRRILNSRAERLKELFLRGDIGEREYARRRRAIEAELRRLIPEQVDLSRVAGWLGDLSLVWERARPAQRRLLVQVLIRSVHVRGEVVERIEPRAPFSELFRRSIRQCPGR